MSENDSRLSDAPSVSSQYVGVIVGVGQQITEVSKKFRECHHGNCQRYGRMQINGNIAMTAAGIAISKPLTIVPEMSTKRPRKKTPAREAARAVAQPGEHQLGRERAVTGKRSLTSEEMGRCAIPRCQSCHEQLPTGSCSNRTADPK